MAKPRMIIADTDLSYIIPLQFKFVEEFFEKVEIEIITDKEYYEQLFSTPQKADVLVVSEELYDTSLQRHNISNIFLMTEQYEDDETGELNVNRIFKYTSIKGILNEIVGKSAASLGDSKLEKNEPQMILVYSACGGVGKTTVAMGMSACLTRHYKRVLYINAGRIQSFQRLLDNQSAITAADVYAKLANPADNAYNEVKHVIRQELFHYLPPFSASLMSLGLHYSIYEQIAVGAKKSGNYDFIIVDADSSFDEDTANLINAADKVVIVTRQDEASVYATNVLVSNINGAVSEKYIYVCNQFGKERHNALFSSDMTVKFSVSDYIDRFTHYDQMKPADFSKDSSMQRTALLIL